MNEKDTVVIVANIRSILAMLIAINHDTTNASLMILKYLFYNSNVSVYTYPIKIMHLVKYSDFDVGSRLYEIQKLKDGWYDGEQGSQLSKDGIAWLAQSWRYFSRNDVSAPCFFPTIEGNIQAEWSFGDV